MPAAELVEVAIFYGKGVLLEFGPNQCELFGGVFVLNELTFFITGNGNKISSKRKDAVQSSVAEG